MGPPRHRVSSGQLFPAKWEKERIATLDKATNRALYRFVMIKCIAYTLSPPSHQTLRTFTKQNFINLDPTSLGLKEITAYPLYQGKL